MYNQILTFPSAQDARNYRYQNGTGGYIFVPDIPAGALPNADNAAAVLFPPSFPPSRIFAHPMTRGRSGTLIGAN